MPQTKKTAEVGGAVGFWWPSRRSMEYDFLGRRTKLSNPDTELTEFSFDAAGNLKQKV